MNRLIFCPLLDFDGSLPTRNVRRADRPELVSWKRSWDIRLESSNEIQSKKRINSHIVAIVTIKCVRSFCVERKTSIHARTGTARDSRTSDLVRGKCPCRISDTSSNKRIEVSSDIRKASLASQGSKFWRFGARFYVVLSTTCQK